MNVRKLLLIVILTGVPGMLMAQSNEQLDRFMEQETALAADSLLLVAQAVGELDSDAKPAQAMDWAKEKKWGKKLKKISADSPMHSGLFHLALLQSFGIRGGWAFNWFPGPRTAVLEAGYQGFIAGQPYVNHPMSPDEVLYSLSTALEIQEAAQ